MRTDHPIEGPRIKSVSIEALCLIGLIGTLSVAVVGLVDSDRAQQDYLGRRKIENIGSKAARISAINGLNVPNQEKKRRRQETIEGFRATASLYVQRHKSIDGKISYSAIQHLDLNRVNKGPLTPKQIAAVPEFNEALKIRLDPEKANSPRRGSGYFYKANGFDYHFTFRPIGTGESGHELWGITNATESSEELRSVSWTWLGVLSATAGLTAMAIAAWSRASNNAVRFYLREGLAGEMPGWVLSEYKSLWAVISSAKTGLSEAQQNLLASAEETARARDIAEENRSKAEAAKKEVENVNHISAHDIKADVISTLKGCEVVSETVDDLQDYIKGEIDLEILSEELSVISKFAGMGVSACRNAFDMIDQRNKLANLEANISIEPWTIKDLEGSIEASSISTDGHFEIHNDCPEDTRVMCDKLFFLAAIKNIIRNGFIHNDEQSKRVVLRINLDGDSQVSFKITDNGVGIPPEYLERWGSIQGKSAKISDKGGSGTGLYSIRKTLEAHKADFALTSEVGVGSTFLISLQRC